MTSRHIATACWLNRVCCATHGTAMLAINYGLAWEFPAQLWDPSMSIYTVSCRKEMYLLGSVAVWKLL